MNKHWMSGTRPLLVLAALLLLLTGCTVEQPLAAEPEPGPPQALESEPPPPEEPPEPEPDPEETPAPELRPALTQALERGDKLVALTFDDGPYDPGTRNMLELLREEEVLATFFLVGRNARVFPELAQQAAQDGHQIGNHTGNHLELPDLDPPSLEEEVHGNGRWIEELTGSHPAMLRPPGGCLSDEVVEALGMPVILWSVDPRDWATTDAHAIYTHVMEHTRDGDIVLLHDVYTASVEAAAMIIPALREQGFFFVTVEELILLRGELEPGRVYHRLPPPDPDPNP